MIKESYLKRVRDGMLKTVMEVIFGKVEEKENGVLEAYYGALNPLRVWLEDENMLCVESNMNPNVTHEVGLETRARYNQFLEDVTGYDTKARIKNLRKQAEKTENLPDTVVNTKLP